MSDFQIARSEKPQEESKEPWPLLDLLDPDRKMAELEYSSLQRRLVYLCWRKHHPDPEDAAAEALKIAGATPIDKIKEPGNIKGFVYGIAKNLIKEQMREGRKLSSLDYLREKVGFEPAQRKPEDTNRERRYNITRNVALRDCLARIEEPNRSYFLKYVSECDEGSREEMRRELARRAEISSDALRTRMHEVRTRLKNCLKHLNLHQRKPRDRDRTLLERRKIERAEQNSDES